MKITRKQLRRLILETMTTPVHPLVKQMRDDDRIDPRIKTLLGSDDAQNVVMGANLVSTIHDDIKDYEDLDLSLADPDTFSPEYEASFKKLSQNPLSDVVNKITQETGFTEDEIRKGVYLIDLVFKYPFNYLPSILSPTIMTKCLISFCHFMCIFALLNCSTSRRYCIYNFRG